MKLTITRAEVDTMIRGSFNLLHDVEIEIVESEEKVALDNNQLADNGWIINTQTEPRLPPTLGNLDIIEVILSDGQTRITVAHAWDRSWNINNDYGHIVKYRKHRG